MATAPFGRMSTALRRLKLTATISPDGAAAWSRSARCRTTSRGCGGWSRLRWSTARWGGFKVFNAGALHSVRCRATCPGRGGWSRRHRSTAGWGGSRVSTQEFCVWRRPDDISRLLRLESLALVNCQVRVWHYFWDFEV